MTQPQPKPRIRHLILDDEDIEIRAADDGSKIHRITIFKNEKARSGPELSLKGMSIAAYKRNPTVQWAHDTMGYTPSGGLPIGRTVLLDKDDSRIKADFTFLQDDPFASRVENAWEQGYIRAASVSWRSIESERIDGEEQDWFGTGWRDTKSELLEWSLVPVPADPGALRESFVRSVIADPRFLMANDFVAGEARDAQALITREDVERIAREILAEHTPPIGPEVDDDKIEADYTQLLESIARIKATLGGS